MGEYFIFTIASFSAIVFIAIVKVCFASKCDSVNLCYGLCQIHRAVNLELSQLPNQSIQEMGSVSNSSPNRFPIQRVLSNFVNLNEEKKSPHMNYSSITQMKTEKTLGLEVPLEQNVASLESRV